MPPEVMMRREGSAYVFTHRTLGLLGKLQLKGLGPAEQHGSQPLDECPSALLKVWPAREPLRKITPPAFEQVLRDLSAQHCGGGR